MRGNGGKTSQEEQRVDPVAVRRGGDDQRLAARHVLKPLDLDPEPEQSPPHKAEPEFDAPRLQRGPQRRRKRRAFTPL